jgi:hypothetical protein
MRARTNLGPIDRPSKTLARSAYARLGRRVAMCEEKNFRSQLIDFSVLDAYGPWDLCMGRSALAPELELREIQVGYPLPLLRLAPLYTRQ